MFKLEPIRDNGCGIRQSLQDPLQKESQVVVDQHSLRGIVLVKGIFINLDVISVKEPREQKATVGIKLFWKRHLG